MVAGGFASTLQVRVAESSPAVAGPDNELDAVTFGGSSNAKFYKEGKDFSIPNHAHAKVIPISVQYFVSLPKFCCHPETLAYKILSFWNFQIRKVCQKEVTYSYLNLGLKQN